MCTPTAMAVAAVGTKAIGIGMQNNASAAMAEAQATGSYKSMNYAFQNYEINRQDAYDAAVNEIMKVRINQQQLNSQVNAAVMEGYQGGGRTASRLMRAAEADTARTVSSIQDNYMRKSNEIDLNKEQTLKSTQDYVSKIKDQYKPNKFADILSLATTGINAYNSFLNDKTAEDVALGKTKETNALSGAFPSVHNWPIEVGPFRLDVSPMGDVNAVNPYAQYQYTWKGGNLVENLLINSGGGFK